eukprot:4415811-Alexandrium_andersonii.AAC.1
MAKGCRECRLEDCGLELAHSRLRAFRPPPSPALVGGFGICANSCAERTRRELWGPIVRPVLGPRGSRFERLERWCACYARRIADRGGS